MASPEDIRIKAVPGSMGERWPALGSSEWIVKVLVPGASGPLRGAICARLEQRLDSKPPPRCWPSSG